MQHMLQCWTDVYLTVLSCVLTPLPGHSADRECLLTVGCQGNGPCLCVAVAAIAERREGEEGERNNIFGSGQACTPKGFDRGRLAHQKDSLKSSGKEVIPSHLEMTWVILSVVSVVIFDRLNYTLALAARFRDRSHSAISRPKPAALPTRPSRQPTSRDDFWLLYIRKHPQLSECATIQTCWGLITATFTTCDVIHFNH